MKNLFYILITMLVLSPALSNAGTGEELFSLGNEAYNRADYDSAITCYKKIEKEGNVSAALFYNMGNTWFRMNDLPMAILYYERAKKLDPTDDDLIKNIQLTNSKLTDRIKELPIPFLNKTFIKITHLLKPLYYNILLILMVWISFSLFGLYLKSKNLKRIRIYFFSGITCLIISIFVFLINISIQNRQNSNDEAILMDESEYIMSSPAADSNQLFLLHEGSKVFILDQVGDWAQIKLANGDKGWIPVSSLVII